MLSPSNPWAFVYCKSLINSPPQSFRVLHVGANFCLWIGKLFPCVNSYSIDVMKRTHVLLYIIEQILDEWALKFFKHFPFSLGSWINGQRFLLPWQLQDIMWILVEASASTMCRIFVAWMVLICCTFESIDMKPLPGFIEAFLPQCFPDAGFSDVGILGDNTETWTAQF